MTRSFSVSTRPPCVSRGVRSTGTNVLRTSALDPPSPTPRPRAPGPPSPTSHLWRHPRLDHSPPSLPLTTRRGPVPSHPVSVVRVGSDQTSPVCPTPAGLGAAGGPDRRAGPPRLPSPRVPHGSDKGGPQTRDRWASPMEHPRGGDGCHAEGSGVGERQGMDLPHPRDLQLCQSLGPPGVEGSRGGVVLPPGPPRPGVSDVLVDLRRSESG